MLVPALIKLLLWSVWLLQQPVPLPLPERGDWLPGDNAPGVLPPKPKLKNNIMGLDQSAFIHIGPDEVSYLQSWRKHNALQGWMEGRYREKGGIGEFNCVNLELDKDDIADLEQVVLDGELPETVGFFFGNDSSMDEYQFGKDIEFITAAKKTLAEGNKVYYSSWW